jgi:hypothetical protein
MRLLPAVGNSPPDEVLVVAFDEQRLARRLTSLGTPRREVAGTIVPFGRTVDPVRVGPDAEVPDVQHPLEAHAERLLEGEDVLVEPVEGSVDVTGGADDHGFVLEPTMPRSR